MTECQATLLRFQARFDVLDGQTTKIVQGNESLERKRKAQREELESTIDRAATHSRRLDLPNKEIDLVLGTIEEKARELPPVISFHDSQERAKV